MLVLALGVWGLRTTVAVPVRVESASMAPTLDVGDIVLVSRWKPDPAELNRGDLIVFRDPAEGRRALKRVIGLPGEEVVVLDGVLHVDGEPVEEPWVDPATVDGYYTRMFVVPADHVFVMGDNRGNSVDSRDYGSLSSEDILGRVLLRVWPL